MGKGSPASTTTESNPWAPSVPHLEKILSEMGGWYDSAKNEGYISQTGDLNSIYGDYLNQMQQMQGSATQTGQDMMNQGLEGLQGTQDFYNKLMNGGSDITSADITGMANDFIDNDLLQGQIDAANQDTVRNFTENTIPGIDRAAVDSGNMGSSRTGVSAAVAERGANEQMAATSATMRGNAYNNALNQAQTVLNGNVSNQMLGAQGQYNGSNNMIGQGSSWGSNMTNTMSPMLQSAQMQAMLQQATQADKIGNRDYLANLLGQYSNIASGIGGMGGTSTTTQQSAGTSSFDKLLQIGGTAAMFMSDERLKRNIEVVGKQGDVEIVKWDWNDIAKERFGLEGSEVGVLAQDILETHPECVGNVDGFYAVNYDRLIQETV